LIQQEEQNQKMEKEIKDILNDQFILKYFDKNSVEKSNKKHYKKNK
jgi:hypothetical protein